MGGASETGADDAAPVNVLLLHHAAVFGGAERGLLDIVLSLRGSRYRPIVVLPGPGPLSERLNALGAPVHFAPLSRLTKTRRPLRLLGYAFGQLFCALRLARLIRRERVAWTHANSDTAQLYGGLAATLARVPALWHCRDCVSLGRVRRWMAARATRMLAVSQATADNAVGDLAACSPRAAARLARKTVVISNAVDTDRFRPQGTQAATRRELGLAADAFVAGMVAHWSPWKGHALFLQAAQRIVRAVPDAVFLVVGADLFGDGDNWRLALDRQVSELGLGDRVRFLGARDDMPALYEAMDVLIHPARREPFGRAVAEAMAMETPVVAVNEGGPAEMIEQDVGGRLVEPNPDALAEAAVALARDSALRRRTGRAARQRIRDRFGLDGYRARLLELYDSL